MRRSLWVLLGCMLAALPASAQETRGNISGTVRDTTGLRGPGLTYINVNVSRNFRLGGRRTLQARVDVQNLLNYAAYNNPSTDPTNANFGKVTTAVAAAGAMRFFQFAWKFNF